MRPLVIVVLVGLAGCHLLPPPPLPSPPASPVGDTVLLFGQEVAANHDAIRAAFVQRCPPGTPYEDVVERLTAEGFPLGITEGRDKKWMYAVSAPLLMTSRWGLVQTVRVRMTEIGGPEDVSLDGAKQLPETALLAACPNLHRLPGLPRADAEALLRANGFAVRERTTGFAVKSKFLFARRWAEEPSVHAASAVVFGRIENDRLVTLMPATPDHPSRSFDGFVGLFPSRTAPAVEQAKAYATIPFTLAGLFGLGLVQWAALPLGV